MHKLNKHHDSLFFTLYVPSGSKKLYQTSYIWQDFINVIEFEATAVHLPELSSPPLLKIIDCSLEISNTGLTGLVSLFDVNGRPVYESVLPPYVCINTPALPAGLYILRTYASEGASSMNVLIR